jgi:mono/diheme cytochrome c family protein/YHS domain-containing protein
MASTAFGAEVTYEATVRALLVERCGQCHGEDKQRGGLGLHTPASITEGGFSGPVLVAGKPAESLIIQRLKLPLDDDDHMPPKDQPQLTADQIAAVEAWILAGGKFDSARAEPSDAFAPGPSAPEASAPSTTTKPTAITGAAAEVAASRTGGSSAAARPARAPATTAPAAPSASPIVNVAAADSAALAALQAHFVHVEPVVQGTNLLRLNFAAAAARTTDAEAVRLLEPVLEQIESLSLSRCRVGDETMALLAGAPHLRRLDLRASQVTDAGVAALARVSSLRELVLTGTRLSDEAVEHLLSMPSLRRVYLWKSGLGKDVVSRLRRQRPDLHVDAGDTPLATSIEVEPEIKFTSEAPLPQSQPAGSVAANTPSTLTPAGASNSDSAPSSSAAKLVVVNTTCPISGKPVDARYSIVHNGRVIGFCCPNCPGQFWADPAKYEAKLPQTGKAD